jgi:hypothetical protein
MTYWRKRNGRISGSAGAEAHGNTAQASRGEYDGAIISTQQRGDSGNNDRPPLTLIWRGQKLISGQRCFGSTRARQFRQAPAGVP